MPFLAGMMAQYLAKMNFSYRSALNGSCSGRR